MRLIKRDFHYSFKKPSKRSYLDLFTGNNYNNKKENIINNTIINLNINNNYYYLNNNKYNISSKEKYGISLETCLPSIKRSI